MSDSDDTDVLLLIPSDLFLIPSSDSEENFNTNIEQQKKTGVVSELIDHMQTLESRILAIESKDSPYNFWNTSCLMTPDGITSSRQTMPKTKYTVSQHSNLQSTPTKQSQCFSLPSTPNIRQKPNYSNERKDHCLNFDGNHPIHRTEPSYVKKHDHSKSFSENLHSQHGLQTKNVLNAAIGSPGKDSYWALSPALNICENNSSLHSHKSLSTGCNSSNKKLIKDMDLPEVNQRLKEIQNNDGSRLYGNRSPHGNTVNPDSDRLGRRKIFETKTNGGPKNNTIDREKKHASSNRNTMRESVSACNYGKRKDFVDYSLPDSSFSSFDTDRFQTEFKTWNSSCSQNLACSRISESNLKNLEDSDELMNGKQTEISKQSIEGSEKNGFPIMGNFQQEVSSRENYDEQVDEIFFPVHSDELPKTQVPSGSTPSNFTLPGSLIETIDIGKSIVGDSNCFRSNSSSNNNESGSNNKRPQCLLTLSDIWNDDPIKPVEERLRLRLGEEKFRREHCEQLIQELQKKLLEKEEKLAVAIRVDDEKNSFISQFQVSWIKMKHKCQQLEIERENLQEKQKDLSDKLRLEQLAYQEEIGKYKEESSKTLNLATGYKEKYDEVVKEKVEMLKTHRGELQNYKKQVGQAEDRYETMKTEYQNLLEKNIEANEALKCVQQELDAELMKSTEIRVELSVIHKALDACEAELAILRQEKENLQLKLKEECDRNNILGQGKQLLAEAVDEAKKSEKLAIDQMKFLTEQQEKLRSELRDVYQKQVDEVVRTKLHEFQTQLDSAESVYQNEVEVKQRAIAECAARKIKSVMDKHQLEINLIEEKHKEEKKLIKIKLAQAVEKSTILETQLNSYRKSKSHLVEQLYSMLQKQWQQALVIISGNNGSSMSSLQKLSVDKLFDIPNGENLESIPEYSSTLCTDFVTPGVQKVVDMQSVHTQDIQNESSIAKASNGPTPWSDKKESESDLKKYIKMILEMQRKDDYRISEDTKDNAPSSERETFYKQSLGQYSSMTNEENSNWQPILEVSIHDTSEYLSPLQKFASKSDKVNEKPPWK